MLPALKSAAGCLWESSKYFLKVHRWQQLGKRRMNTVNGGENYCGPGILHLSQEVQEGLHAKKAVVALESTIITHGMPYPQNLSTALAIESIVRQHGAIPATVAVMEGKIHVGLSQSELQRLAEGNTGAVKTSKRDLPYVLSQGLTGGTTVSGTMVAAHRAGIPVFVTGGVGGVHRGAESSMDISADLTELGRTPVAVVSAGVKSILDVGRTLEYLETQGVCVATFGPRKDFPAFFTPVSGFQSPYNVQTPLEAADMINSSLSLGLRSGLLIAVPVPTDCAADGELVEDAIQTALQETVEKGVSGKDVTPYILQRVNELTKGKSLQANIALVQNNAKVGAQIAVELAKLRNQSESSKVGQRSFRFSKGSTESQKSVIDGGRMVVVGAINVDFTAAFATDNVQPNGATYPGSVRQSLGGVGRNLADCLSRLGCDPLFISMTGSDAHAENFRLQCSHMDLSAVHQHPTLPTATYCAILRQSSELIYGTGDFTVHKEITPDLISQYEQSLVTAPLVCMDGNLSADSIEYVCDICHQNNVPVFFEPTDVHNPVKLSRSQAWTKLTYTSPNLHELRVLNAQILHVGVDTASSGPGNPAELTESQVLEESLHLVTPVLDHIPNVLVTLGHHGVLVCRRTEAAAKFPTRGHQLMDGPKTAVHYPAQVPGMPPPVKVSVSGAGDCFAAALIARILEGAPLDVCVKSGLLAAQLSLGSHQAVPHNVTPEALSLQAVRTFAPWQPRTLL